MHLNFHLFLLLHRWEYLRCLMHIRVYIHILVHEFLFKVKYQILFLLNEIIIDCWVYLPANINAMLQRVFDGILIPYWFACWYFIKFWDLLFAPTFDRAIINSWKFFFNCAITFLPFSFFFLQIALRNFLERINTCLLFETWKFHTRFGFLHWTLRPSSQISR